jgi:hypothetical protein
MFGLFMGVIDTFKYHKCQLIWWEENYILCDKFKKNCLWNEVVKNNSGDLNLNSLDVRLHNSFM